MTAARMCARRYKRFAAWFVHSADASAREIAVDVSAFDGVAGAGECGLAGIAKYASPGCLYHASVFAGEQCLQECTQTIAVSFCFSLLPARHDSASANASSPQRRSAVGVCRGPWLRGCAWRSADGGGSLARFGRLVDRCALAASGVGCGIEQWRPLSHLHRRRALVCGGHVRLVSLLWRTHSCVQRSHSCERMVTHKAFPKHALHRTSRPFRF